MIVCFNFFWKNSSWTLSPSNPISFSFLVRSFEWFKTWWVCQSGLYKTSFYSRSQDVMIKDFKLEILICFNSLITEHWILVHQTPCIFPIPLLKWTIFATNTPCLSHSFTEMSNFCDVAKHPVSSSFHYWNDQFLQQTPYVFPIPLLKWAIFVMLPNNLCLSYSFTEMSNFCNVDKHPMSFLFLYWNEQFLRRWQTPHVFPIPLLKWAIFAMLKALGGGLQMFFELQKKRNNVWGFNLFWVLKCLLISLSTLSKI
jgi:hypothetical protein